MPGNAFTQHQIAEQFERAVEEGEPARAWNLARRLDPVRLDQALALTVLLGRARDRRFEAAALRFVERFVVEARPSLTTISKVADALQTVGRVGDLPAMSDGAARALADLRRQLRSHGR
jgi:hypothetical protein